VSALKIEEGTLAIIDENEAQAVQRANRMTLEISS
jgi:hypothetical protein